MFLVGLVVLAARRPDEMMALVMRVAAKVVEDKCRPTGQNERNN
jgi:hypothetical protein